MIPIDMQILHRPENGFYGDCFRCCIASIMELPAKEVPHFCGLGDDDTDGQWFRDLEQWLIQFNLAPIMIELSAQWDMSSTNIIYVRSGKTVRGTRHSTVWRKNTMIHDPHPDRTGILMDVFPQDLILLCRR